MSPLEFTLRRGTLADAECLSLFAREVFPLGGRPGASQADLDAYFESKITPEHFRSSIANENNLVIVAESGNGIAGYGELLRSSPHPEIPEPNPSEVRKLYVGPRFHGLGISDALMRALLAEAAHPVWLSVFSENPRAVRFYERWGFKIIGTQQFLVGTDSQQDFLMRRDAQKGTE